MPIYEYVCSDCSLQFELVRPLSQASEGAPCPRCHNGAKRVFSGFTSRSKDDSGLTAPLAGSDSSAPDDYFDPSYNP